MREMKADIYRLKKTSFFKFHIGMPLLGIIAYTIYMVLRGEMDHQVAFNFYVLMSLVFPILISGVCDIVYSQELEVNGGFWMLSALSRQRVLLSKLRYLLFSGFIACFMTVLLFSLILALFQGHASNFLGEDCKIVAIIFGTSIFLYLFHSWVLLKLGSMVSYGLAAFEVLIGALMVTGLGEIVWIIFPSAWGVRALMQIQKENSLFATSSYVIIMTIVTVGFFIYFLRWFDRWEGNKMN